MNIQRYDVDECCNGQVIEAEDGCFVLYKDHEAIVDRLKDHIHSHNIPSYVEEQP